LAAGYTTFVGNPIFMAQAIMFFAGLGSIMFVGGGSATLGYNPFFMATAVNYMAGAGDPYWVTVSRARIIMLLWGRGLEFLPLYFLASGRS
jgi:hypothetical protein